MRMAAAATATRGGGQKCREMSFLFVLYFKEETSVFNM
jgi:hypothetical protein